jgi:anti-anti-sigma regulatory factor
LSIRLEIDVQSRGAMSGVLSLGTLDPAFTAASSVDGDQVVLDLKDVEFVEPAGICGLATLLEYLIPRSKNVRLALEGRDGRQVAAYLERMDFFRLFGGRISTDADLSSLEERKRHNPGTLQELVNFQTEDEIPGIVQRIAEILETMGYKMRERVDICSTLSEICANAAEHGVAGKESGAPAFGAYAAVQAYNHVVSGGSRGDRRGGEEVIVAIADGGPGIRDTLARNPANAEFTGSDNEALRHAIKMGVSSSGEVGRGGGLNLVSQIAARAGGSLSLRSGSGRVTAYKDRTNSRNVPAFPGTFVRVSLPRGLR